MPTTLMVVPVVNNVPDLQLLEGETLEYSIGFVDVWRDDEEEEPTEPVKADKWTKADPVEGAWTRYKTLTDEDGVITGYNVDRRYLESVEALRGAWTATSAIPPYLPPDTTTGTLVTTEAMINTLHDRLYEIDHYFGRRGEIVPDDN